MKLQKIISEGSGTVIDVRTVEEYKGGNVKGSINIPLSELDKRLDEIKKLSEPLVLCCASGGRSGQATAYLLQKGINCLNGGSWLDVNYYQTA